tara:strand:+ start:696 stop:1310 length:615 start_codon:yes stop_codon:yes gene_type:complete
MVENIINFGGECIYQKNIGESLTSPQLKFLKSSPLEEQFPKGHFMSVERNILHDPIMKNVREKLDEYIKYYTQKLWGISNRFELKNSWLTINSQEAYHQPHNHSNSILSLSYYLKIKSGNIFFNLEKAPIQRAWFFDYDVIKENHYNTPQMTLPLKDNDIIIFPSHLTHGTLPNNSLEKRVTLIANYFIKGKIGSKVNLTYLEL